MMEKSVDILFTEEILKCFLESFHLQTEVKKLGDFENYVFEAYRGNKPVILRITHSTHRSKDEILAELDWMNFLHQQKVNCPEAFTSSNNQLIEDMPVGDGSFFYACLFSKVDGYPVKIKSDVFNNQLFHAWGKAIGHMHSVTKEYKPSKEIKLRPAWENEELLDIESYVPNEKEVIKNTKLLIKELKSLPINKDNFGLIHSDIHSGNFFMMVNVFMFLISMIVVIIGLLLILQSRFIIPFYMVTIIVVKWNGSSLQAIFYSILYRGMKSTTHYLWPGKNSFHYFLC